MNSLHIQKVVDFNCKIEPNKKVLAKVDSNYKTYKAVPNTQTALAPRSIVYRKRDLQFERNLVRYCLSDVAF